MATRVYLGEAADPATRPCDWCGEPGVKAIEIRKPRKKVGTGQFMYPVHRQQVKDFPNPRLFDADRFRLCRVALDTAETPERAA